MRKPEKHRKIASKGVHTSKSANKIGKKDNRVTRNQVDTNVTRHVFGNVYSSTQSHSGLKRHAQMKNQLKQADISAANASEKKNKAIKAANIAARLAHKAAEATR